MQIYCNKRKRLHRKRVQLPGDWFGTPTWKPFHCFGTPIWPRDVMRKHSIGKSKNIFIAVDISQFLALYILLPIAATLWIAGIKREYLTIIPRARMGSESIAHEAEGRIGHWLRVHEGERSNCFSNIQLVGQKYRDKTTLTSKMRFSCHCFAFQSRRFSLPVGYNI